MKNLLLILALAFSYVTYGQTAPMTNNVPWYEFSKKLSVGKFLLKSEGEHSTDFTIAAVTGSVTLDTITADRTVTFSDGASTDKGVIIFVQNANNSAFVWNVAGNVKEADGTVITNLPRGLHVFYWNSNAWIRLSTSGGSSPTVDTLTFSSPIIQLDKNVSLDFDAFPQDTVGVVEHNDSLFNILYSHTGTRDSTFIVKLGAGGGGDGIYGGSGSLPSDVTVTQGAHSLDFTGSNSTHGVTSTNTGDGDAIVGTATNGVGGHFESTSNFGIHASSAIVGGLIDVTSSSTNTIAEVLRLSRYTSGTPGNNIGASMHFEVQTSSSTSYPLKIKTQWTDKTHATRTSKTVFTGYSAGTETDWFSLIPSYALIGTDTAATRAWVRANGGATTAYVDSVFNSGDSLYYTNVGATGDSLLTSVGDVLYIKKIRDSTGIDVAVAPDGALTIRNTGSTNSWDKDGNTVTSEKWLGTVDAFALPIRTNNTERARYLGTGGYVFGGTTLYNQNFSVKDTIAAYGLRLIPTSQTYPIPGTYSSALFLTKANNSTANVYSWMALSSSNATLFSVDNSGVLDNTWLNVSGSAINSKNTSATNFTASVPSSYANPVFRFFANNSLNPTSGNPVSVISVGGNTFAPSSGTSAFIGFDMASTINMSGSAGGAAVGFYSRPTLTSVASGKYYSVVATTTAASFGRFAIDDAAETTTTNATPTTIFTYPLATSATQLEIDITVRGVSGSDYAMYRKLIRYKNVSGTLTALGSVQSIGTDFEDAALSACDITATTSGTNILIQATGIAATTIVWRPVATIKAF